MYRGSSGNDSEAQDQMSCIQSLQIEIVTQSGKQVK